MKKDEGARHLTASEFLATGRNGSNQQVANARWQFMLAVQGKVPAFFERLRPHITQGALHTVRVWETEKNWAECTVAD